MTSSRGALVPLLWVALVDSTAINLMLVYLPLLSVRYSLTALEYGWLVSAYAIAQLLCAPALGMLSDRYGRKRVLLLCQVGTAMSFGVLLLARDFPLLLVSRILDGATGGNIVLAYAMAADLAEDRDVPRAFGLVGAAFGLGFVAGPLLMAIASHGNPLAPIPVALACSLAAVLLSWILLPAHRGEDGQVAPASLAQQYRWWRASPPSARFTASFRTQAVFFVGYTYFLAGFLLLAKTSFPALTDATFGILFVGAGALAILTQGVLLKPLLDRFAEHRIVRSSFLAVAVSALGWLAAPTSVAALVGCLMVFAVGTSVIRPALLSSLVREVGAGRQGLLLGLTQSLYSLCQVLTPSLSGLILEADHRGLWVLVAGLVFGVGWYSVAATARPGG